MVGYHQGPVGHLQLMEPHCSASYHLKIGKMVLNQVMNQKAFIAIKYFLLIKPRDPSTAVIFFCENLIGGRSSGTPSF